MNNIKKIRNSKKLTVQELSYLSKVATGYLSDIENNKANPTINTLIKISNALEVPITDLIDNNNTSRCN